MPRRCTIRRLSMGLCVYAGDNNQGEGEQDSAHLFQRTIHVLKAKAAFVNVWLPSSFTVCDRVHLNNNYISFVISFRDAGIFSYTCIRFIRTARYALMTSVSILMVIAIIVGP